MFDIKKDRQAMITFRRNPAKFMKHLKKTKKPLILTVNGKSRSGSSGCRILSAPAGYRRTSGRTGRPPSRHGRLEKGPRASGAQSAGNVPAQPCHTSLGSPTAPFGPSTYSCKPTLRKVRSRSSTASPKQFIVWSDFPSAGPSFEKTRSSAICSLAKAQAHTESSTR
jgi:hypothetical protein